MASETQLTWALVSGEYPPAAGGVADYTAHLAGALAAAGDAVHVFAPGPLDGPAGAQAPTLHALPDRFGRGGLERLGQGLAGLDGAARVLIQYVPHAYGRRGMNLGFCSWIARRPGLHRWVMFHEVAYPREAGQRLRHRLLAEVTWRMARRLQRSAERSFVAIPAWGEWLREIAPGSVEAQWLPVPSNLPVSADAGAIAAARRGAGAGAERVLLGWFGARLSPYARAVMPEALAALLCNDERRLALLLGSAGPELRQAVLNQTPQLAGRVHAPGPCPAAALAAQISACDLLLQPYPDGVSCRRGTTMAALALGRPLLTTLGRLSEPLWQTSGAVALAPAAEPAALTAAAAALLDDPERRAALGATARRLYQDRFALEHTVAKLRAAGRS